jgi:hypothetical protein
MTEALAVRMADLPSIGTASLPANYEAATEALARCHRIDECKDWADKMAALASYAKQAADPTLRNFALRISARAIRRAGELLQTFENQGARTDQLPAGTVPKSQTQAGSDAGMSERQVKTAVRVANVPDDAFEAAIECECPATVTQLAEMGTTPKPKVAPPGFVQATHALGTIREFAILCRDHPAPFIAGGMYPYEVAAVRADVAVITQWLAVLLVHLQEGS